jgi:hypothetical protein
MDALTFAAADCDRTLVRGKSSAASGLSDPGSVGDAGSLATMVLLAILLRQSEWLRSTNLMRIAPAKNGGRKWGSPY